MSTHMISQQPAWQEERERDGQKKRSDADRTDNRYGRIGRTGQIKLGV